MRLLVVFSSLFIFGPVQAFQLGQGFDSIRQLWTPQCVEGDRHYVGDQTGILNVEVRKMSGKMLFKQIFQTSAGVNLGIIGAKGKVSVDQTLKSDDNTWFLVFSFEAQEGSQILRNIRLNEFGEKALAITDSQKFKDYCGDQYLSRRQRGTKVYLMARYRFKEQMVATTFKFKVEVKIGGEKITKTITKSLTAPSELRSYDQFVAIEGGNTEEMEETLKTMMGGCRVEDMKTCDQSFDKLVAYIQGEEFYQNAISETENNLSQSFNFYPINLISRGEI